MLKTIATRINDMTSSTAEHYMLDFKIIPHHYLKIYYIILQSKY